MPTDSAKDILNEIQIHKIAQAEAAMANDPDMGSTVETPNVKPFESVREAEFTLKMCATVFRGRQLNNCAEVVEIAIVTIRTQFTELALYKKTLETNQAQALRIRELRAKLRAIAEQAKED